MSWPQGQSHRRLLDASTVQLCTKVISEWTEGIDATQIAQYQLNLINNGKAPLTGITMSLTNFKPWYDQYWKFNYNNDTQTATLPGWRVPLVSGQTFEFGYIQAGANGATFLIQDVQFAAVAKRRSN
ncbi:alpha-expansin [Klebsormidium nitens]|uniref:Alpha-expansin n=1 Tax=Klebsormidium nitens TaxID=105231 RepID=A0A1Y1INQ7_KLENI|nr:alpha-expansin [Klebsormidium nitens]|eukprot:GAQ89748.1 alpha-expansin [Klebsormidium nitens]